MTWYVVMARQTWDFKVDGAWHPLQHHVKVKGWGDRYLPVYRSREAAERDFPGCTLMVLEAEDDG